jgi:hypothetical protein
VRDEGGDVAQCTVNGKLPPVDRLHLDEVVDCARTFSNLIARARALLEGVDREALPARAAEGSS